MEMANQDTLWACFSVGFVYLYFIFHLRSLFLATMAIIVILCSFPMAAIINMGIFRNTFYQNVHAILVFIILGIGADGIFVFIDGWR